jgi:asparagine synthase (glutamine-hydrolysing)
LKLVAKEWLPKDIWRRTKRPYRAPIYSSFFNPKSIDYVRELLSQGVIHQAGMFDYVSVRQLLKKAETRKQLSETDEMALVGILSSQLVYSKFIKGFDVNPPLSQADDVKVCRKELKPQGW